MRRFGRSVIILIGFAVTAWSEFASTRFILEESGESNGFNIPCVDEGGRVGGIMCMGCGNENRLVVLFAVSIFFDH